MSLVVNILENCGIRKLVSLFSAVFWLLAFSLWLVLWFNNPYSKETPLELITPIDIYMVILCLVGMWVSIKRNPILMLTISALSFIPVGLYLLGSPGVFKFIGASNMACFILSLPMYIVETSNKQGKKTCS